MITDIFFSASRPDMGPKDCPVPVRSGGEGLILRWYSDLGVRLTLLPSSVEVRPVTTTTSILPQGNKDSYLTVVPTLCSDNDQIKLIMTVL
jgi:hypothetical protein